MLGADVFDVLASTSSRQTILVAAGDLLVRRDLLSTLRWCGWRVAVVDTATDARPVLLELRPDVVLVDEEPRVAFELLEQTRELVPSTRRVLLVDAAEIATSREADAAELVLRKPVPAIALAALGDLLAPVRSERAPSTGVHRIDRPTSPRSSAAKKLA